MHHTVEIHFFSGTGYAGVVASIDSLKPKSETETP
jgi:hypothetical protein